MDRQRFRVLRVILLIILIIVTAFLGMVVNLTNAGWTGVAVVLFLLGMLSGKAFAKGCLPTLAIWTLSLLCLLTVFVLTARI